MANKNLKRGRNTKKELDIRISRSRKLLLNKIIYLFKANRLNKPFDYADILLEESMEFLRNSEYAVGDERDKEINLSEDEKKWIREEYKKIMSDITIAVDCEYKKTVAELEEIKKRR